MNETVIHATKCMNHQNICQVKEVRQRDNILYNSFIQNVNKKQIYRQGKKFARGWKWKPELTACGHKEPLLGDGNALRLHCGRGCTTL